MKTFIVMTSLALFTTSIAKANDADLKTLNDCLKKVKLAAMQLGTQEIGSAPDKIQAVGAGTQTQFTVTLNWETEPFTQLVYKIKTVDLPAKPNMGFPERFCLIQNISL